jgi:hypothetical protein
LLFCVQKAYQSGDSINNCAAILARRRRALEKLYVSHKLQCVRLEIPFSSSLCLFLLSATLYWPLAIVFLVALYVNQVSSSSICRTVRRIRALMHFSPPSHSRRSSCLAHRVRFSVSKRIYPHPWKDPLLLVQIIFLVC